jgi:hypothetical protein
MRLWPDGAVPRYPAQGVAHRLRASEIPARLLRLPPLPPRSVSARSGTGCRRGLLFARSATHDSGGGQRIQLRTGPRTTGTAGRYRGHRQSRGASGRGHRRRYRSLPAARNWTAKQLELPEVCAPAVPILYIEMDGTGVPVVKAETEGRAGRVGGQPAHTREVKLGCVFTQTAADQDGRPVSDQESTSYVAAIQTAEQFGLRLYSEAWRRGWSRAQKKVVIGDGAGWIWNLADQHFPSAIQIVDLYHARQHLWELSSKRFPNEPKARQRWIARCLDRLERARSKRW